MDANKYALKVIPAGKRLGIPIRKAACMGKGAAPQTKAGLDVVRDCYWEMKSGYQVVMTSD